MSSTRVPANTREQVRDRANNCCEYCLIPETNEIYLPFHAEHIKPEAYGGETTEANLAWACASCNLSKHDKTAHVDPQTENPALLFNPRLQNWGEHFEMKESGEIIGKTETGRATVDALKMNENVRVFEREQLLQERTIEQQQSSELQDKNELSQDEDYDYYYGYSP